MTITTDVETEQRIATEQALNQVQRNRVELTIYLLAGLVTLALLAVLAVWLLPD